MSDPIRFGRLLVVLLLCSACDQASTHRPEDWPLLSTNQRAIEHFASYKPFPRYPTRSRENGAVGVAVASILFGFDGRMEQVDVLEAPDAGIAKAVRDTLGRWELSQDLLDDHPRGPFKVTATMVFYFLIEAGEGRVVSGPVLAAERTASRTVAGKPRRIDEAELDSLLETSDAVVVDLRARELFAQGHLDGAINLPMAELRSRAAVEIPPAQVVIVDCHRGSEPMCVSAGQVLLRAGVPDVAVFVHD